MRKPLIQMYLQLSVPRVGIEVSPLFMRLWKAVSRVPDGADANRNPRPAGDGTGGRGRECKVVRLTRPPLLLTVNILPGSL